MPQRSFAGLQIGASEQCPRVQQQDGTVTCLSQRLSSRRRHHERGPGSYLGNDVGSAGAHDGDARERAAQLFGGTDVADDERPPPVRPAVWALEIGLNRPAPAAGQRRGSAFLRERAAADRQPVRDRAAGRAAADVTGNRWAVSPPGNADQRR